MKPSTTTKGFPTLWPMVVCVVLCLTVAVTVTAAGSNTVVVDCHFGQIRGMRKTDERTGQPFVSFKGIPYAKAPVGQLRFAKPQPHPKIDGVFDATKEDRIICPHPAMMTTGETEFTEDCLVLNIVVKDIGRQEERQPPLKKVLVFIHGGGFMMGSSYFYQSSSIAYGQDIILVTINYRLGVLGFLSTENEASPGNYGLWDQTLALTWVKDNIRAFGGDPDDVTITGESAGGASVGYQMITPHTKGLFTKAYPQSGTATSVFAKSVFAQSHALEIAKRNGCWEKDINYELNLEESRTVVECLRGLSFSELMSFNGFTLSRTMFVPRVDGDFISDTPANLLKDDAYLDSIGFFQRSYLISIVNCEHGILDSFYEQAKIGIFGSNQTSQEVKEMALRDYREAVKQLLFLSRLGERGSSEKAIIDAIDEFYSRRFADEGDALLEMVVDLNFLIPSLDFAMTASRRQTSGVYFFHFDHFPKYVTTGYRRGTTHALDLAYWLDVSLDTLDQLLGRGLGGELPREDLELKHLFSSFLGEFVRSGNPGQALKDILPSGWPKYDVTNSYYLNFNLRPWVSNFFAKDKQDFWFKTVPSLLKDAHRRTHSEL